MSQTFDESSIILLQGLEEHRPNITPSSGELLYTIDTKRVYVGDNITPGGNLVGSYSNLSDDYVLTLINTHTHNHDLLNNLNVNQHIDHSTLNVIVGNGLTGGGILTNNINIAMGSPSTISGTSTNSFLGDSHSHAISATASRDVTNNTDLLLARALKDHIDNENHSGGSDGSDHNHNHDSLNNINTNQHIDHSGLSLIAGDGLSGGGVLTSSKTITLGIPQTISGISANAVIGTTHSHAISATASRDVTNNTDLLLARALKDHIDNENHSGGSDGSDHNHNHDSLNNINTNQHIDHSGLSLIAGDGLSGGGVLTSSKTITLGIPSQLSGITINESTGTTHTHSLLVTDARNVTNSTHLLLAKALKDHIDNENHSGGSDGSDHNHDHDSLNNINTNQHIDHSGLSLIAGDGLSGGGTLDLSRTINLIMPGTLSGTTVNNNTSNHTHQLLVTDARNVTNSTHLLLAKALKDHIDNESHQTIDISQIHTHTIDNNFSNGYGKRYVSSDSPDDSIGNNGDIWLQYEN